MRKVIQALTGAMLFTASFATVSAADKTLVAGVEAAFPPWAYAEDGEYKGIAIDAMRAIAKDQGLDVEFKDLPWPSLIPALSKGRIDLLVTGLNVNEERARVLDFSIPWWETDDEILVPEDSDRNIANAICCGATIAAQAGSTQHTWIQENLVNDTVGADVRTYEDYVTAVEDMLIGRVDSVLVSTDTAEDMISEGRPLKIIGTVQRNQPAALAVQEGDPHDLLGKLNMGIMNLYQSGEWAKIVHKYRPQATVRPIPTAMPDYVDSYKKPIPGYSQ